MKNGRAFAGFFLPALLLLLTVFSGAALAYDVSGAISYGGSRSGRIYLTLTPAYGGNGGYGTSLASPGSFTIQGVPNGEYVLRAFRDTVGNGIRHASDPNGSANVTVQGGNVTGASVTLSDPAYTTPDPPTGLAVLPGSGGAFVLWEGGRDEEGNPTAQSYNLYWSASPSVSPTGYTGSKTGIQARDFDMFIQHGLTNGTTLYYVVTAVDGPNVSAPSEAFGPVTIGPPGGGYSVSGAISFPGISSTGPLRIAVVDEQAGEVYVTTKTSPTTPASFAVAGVPNGTYKLYAILDMNGNGTIDTGDLSASDNSAPTVTVNNGNVTGVNATIQAVNAEASVSTSYWRSGCSDRYSLGISVQSMKRLPVKVTLSSGPGVSSPVDIGMFGRDGFRLQVDLQTAPKAGDQYILAVTYSDGYAEDVVATVSNVLDTFPVPVAPAGFVTGADNTTPTFSWSAPNPAPAGAYSYSLWLQGTGTPWEAYDIPADQTSAPYTGQPLSLGSNYTWYLSIRDANDNSASIEVPFMPVDTVPSPSVFGFNPQNGKPGTTVSITGANFSPNAAENIVTFNGTPTASVCRDWDQLKAVVPLEASDGPIAVTTPGGSAASLDSFTVIPPTPPTVTSFDPASGPPATVVTITGSDFAPTPAGNTVKFNGTAATVSSATETQLVVAVPVGATTGKVTVTTVEGTGTSAADFTVTASGPPVLAVSPASYGFGNVQLGSQATSELIAITNTGAGNLIISSANDSGDTSQFDIHPSGPNPCPEALPATLPPGSACTIEVVFTPTSFGSKNMTMTLVSNDEDTPSFPFVITGAGVGAGTGITLTPAQDGLKVTLAATLTTGSGASISGRTVYFQEGSTVKASGITLADGSVTRAFTSTPGTHAFTAVFKGDAAYAPASAGPEAVAIAKVLLSSPASGAIVTDATPTLAWQVFTGATQYHLLLSTASTFSATTTREVVTAATSAPAPTLLPGKTYYWRVYAETASGKSLPSDFRTVVYKSGTTLGLATPTQQGLKVTLTAALTNTLGTPLAGKTVFFFDGGVAKGSGITNSSGMIIKNLAGTAGSHSFTAMFKGDSSYAPAGSVAQDVVIGKVLLDTPTAGVVVTTPLPTLSWASYPDATSYHVQAATASTFAPAALLFDTEVAGTSHTVTVPLLKGKVYYWRVYAVLPTGTSVPSDFRKLTFKGATSLALELFNLNGATVTMRATLVDPVTGTPIPGKSLTFYENTNAGAFAAKGTTLTGSLTSAAPGIAVKSWTTTTGSHQAYVKFAGNTLYAPADTTSAPVPYTVGAE